VPAVKDLLPFIVVGVTSGSVYGLAGVGLVLTYKTSGVFNFAHGAVAAAAAYGFYDLHVTHGLAWPLAAILCVGVLSPLLGLAIERLARYLADARPVYTILATVGLMLAIQGFLSWKYGATTRNIPQFLPTGSVRLGGVDVAWSQIITVAIGAVASAALYVFFSTRRLGIAMRSVVDDAGLLSLAGTNPTRVRSAAWIIGTAFAGLSGILIAPTIGLDAVLITLLVVQAFGATAIGGFSSLPLTYIGGLAIGVAAALATKFVATRPAFGGLPASIPFIVLFLSLLLRPKGLFTVVASKARVGGRTDDRPDRRPLVLAVGGLTLGFLLVAPNLVGARLPLYSTALVFVPMFLSLALLVWTSGQISLCQAAFAAVGATTFSHLAHGLGLPFPIALLGAGLAVVPLGALLAVPAIRLSGVYLALATFGFGVLMERVAYPTGLMFGRTGLRVAPRPDLGLFPTASDKGFYYVVLALAVLSCGAVALVARSRLGRLLRAMSDSPVCLLTHGLNVNATRVIVFCLSGFLAGITGALFAAQLGNVAPAAFGILQSLLWLTILVLSGTALIRSSIVAAAVLVLLPAYAPDGFVEYQSMLFGVAALTVTMFAVGGHRLTDRLTGLLARRPSDADAEAGAAAGEPAPRRHVPALAAVDRAGTSPVTARYAELALTAREIA
jgi:branched-subunit amino acid ABC-type transport system permease component